MPPAYTPARRGGVQSGSLLSLEFTAALLEPLDVQPDAEPAAVGRPERPHVGAEAIRPGSAPRCSWRSGTGSGPSPGPGLPARASAPGLVRSLWKAWTWRPFRGPAAAPGPRRTQDEGDGSRLRQEHPPALRSASWAGRPGTSAPTPDSELRSSSQPPRNSCCRSSWSSSAEGPGHRGSASWPSAPSRGR